MTKADLEEFLHQQIPLSQAMGVHIHHADENSVILASPLAPNRNHMGTAFGGSLSALAILAGYVWVFEALRRRGHDVHIILKSSRIDFLVPVETDFKSYCESPPAEKVETFLKTFEKKNLARIYLTSSIRSDNQVHCRFEGEFVAQKTQSGATN